MDLNSKIVCFLLLNLFSTYIFCQDNSTKNLKIQVNDRDTEKGIPNLKVNIVGGDENTTDQNGSTELTIKSDLYEFVLQVPQGYKVVKPQNSRYDVKANPNFVYLYEVEKVDRQNKAEMQKRVNTLTQQIDQYKKEKEDAHELLTRQQNLYDSLVKTSNSIQDSMAREIELQKEAIDALTNQEDKLKKERKLLLYAEISRNYLQFLNAILNMKEVLKEIETTFNSESKFAYYNSTVEILNVARDDLHEKHEAYIKAVEEDWDARLSTQLSSLYKQALETIYKNLIIPLNQNLNPHLDNAWHGKKSRVGERKKAKKKINLMLPQLRQEIEDMERIAEEVLEQLSAN